MLERRLGVRHLSTGDLLRAAAESGTPLGRRASGVMRAGDLMPDDMMCEVVRESLGSLPQESVVVLDGFPRTPVQAEALEEMTAPGGLTGAVVLSVPVEEVSGRMHLRGRTDDTEEVIARRLELYENQTAPLVSWFAERGLAVEVDGVGLPEEIFERLSEVVRAMI